MKIGLIAGFISALACIPYFISIIQGKTKPNRVTWWIWTWLGILLFFSYKDSGAKETLWVALVYMITPFITALLSIKYGTGGWCKFDLICLLSSFISSIFWFISGSPLIAMLLFLLIDLSATLPTIKKTYYYPEQEDKLAWFIMTIANLTNLFAVNKIKFSLIIYPLYMLLIGCVIFGLTLRKSTLLKTNNN